MSSPSAKSRENRGETAPLSGRARTALLQLQRRATELDREMRAADRVLAGALSAGTGETQTEMLGSYLESVQELRVCLQRLEAFLMSRVLPGAERD
jgi:hypothetical protein